MLSESPTIEQSNLKDRLNKLFEKLDDDSIQELNSDCFNDAYQKLYKYGQIIEGADNYLTFSFTNLTGEYQTRLLLTAMIGYQFRANDEWEVPNDIQVFSVYEYTKGLSEGRNIIDEYYKKYKEISPKLQKDIDATKEKMKERIIIRKFLEYLYQFDPDRHVRSAYRPNPRDKERTIIDTPAAKLAISCLKFKDATFRETMVDNERNINLMNMSTSSSENKPYNVDFFNNVMDAECDVQTKMRTEFEKTDKELYSTAQKLLKKYKDIDRINVEYLNSSVNVMTNSFEKIKQKFNLSENVLNEIRNEIQQEYDGRLRVLQQDNKKAQSVLNDIVSTIHNDYGLKDNKLLVNTYNMIPPADIFYRINYYKEANYDKLVDAVKNLYCYTPELDMAVIPHNWHSTEDEAHEYVKRYRNQVIAEVVTARSGMWNFFAPYEKVRDTTVFLNDKTIILEEILAETKRSSMLGQDLVSNEMKIKKRQNIREEGAEAEGFKEWRNQHPTFKNMGALQIDPYEDDCPPDAIEIPVYRLNAKEGTLETSKIFTKAEAPSFMAEKEKKE